MMKKAKHPGLFTDQETHFYIAEYEIVYLIRKPITNFEREHGKIELGQKENG